MGIDGLTTPRRRVEKDVAPESRIGSFSHNKLNKIVASPDATRAFVRRRRVYYWLCVCVCSVNHHPIAAPIYASRKLEPQVY